MDKKKTVLITGSNGFIGRSLVHFFASKGWMVKGFQRKEESGDAGKIQFVKYELGKPLSPENFEGADVLIHCAVQQYSMQHPDSDEVNIRGAKDLLSICREKNIRVVFLSTLSAHAEAGSHYGKNKLFLESLFDKTRI